MFQKIKSLFKFSLVIILSLFLIAPNLVNAAPILPDMQVNLSVDLGQGMLTTNTSILTYTIVATNIGTGVANSVIIRDVFPVCTTFNTQVSGITGVLTSNQQNMDFNLGNVLPNQQFTMIIKLNVNQSGACVLTQNSVIQNSATATISSLQTDANNLNNTGLANSTLVNLNQNVTLTLVPSLLIAAPGDTMSYKLKLSPTGSNFTGKIVLTLPAGTSFVSVTAVTNTYILAVSGNTLTYTITNQPDGTPLVSDITAQVNANAIGILSAQATATSAANQVNFAQAITTVVAKPTSKIIGYVFYDANKNAAEDKLERGAQYASVLSNVEIIAVASNAKSYTGLTDNTGAFSINNLPAGKYTVYVNFNTIAKSFNNQILVVAAMPKTIDGLTRVVDVKSNEIFDLTSAFRIFPHTQIPIPQPANQVISGITIVLAQDQTKPTQTTSVSGNSSSTTSTNNQNTATSTTSNTTTQTNPTTSSNPTNPTVNSSSATSDKPASTNSSSSTSISTPTQDPKVLGVSDKQKAEFNYVAGSLIRTGAQKSNNAMLISAVSLFSFAVLGLTLYLSNKARR